MTQTNFSILIILILWTTVLAIEFYKIFVQKKARDKALLVRILLFSTIFFLINFQASYSVSIANYERTENNIPAISESMKLNSRSRFKEVWINTDTAKIKHASKVIRLGNSIEKEIDFFTNEKIVRTLKVKTIFPFAWKKIKQKYFLITGIETDVNGLGFIWDEIEITRFQKDSILADWHLNKTKKFTASSF